MTPMRTTETIETTGTMETMINYYMDQPNYITIGGSNPFVDCTWNINTANTIYYQGPLDVIGTINFVKNDKGLISPELYFTYIKKKLGILERTYLEKRLHRIEAAFDKAVENGQNMLAEKIMNNLAIETRESVIYAKGIKYFIERKDLYRYKNQIKDGHISDTLLKDYTRVIPKDVLTKVKKVKDVFDDFVIFHYYNRDVEVQLEKKQKMNEHEKARMKDPVVFGIIKETDKLYFVADWVDEHCDLTFRKVVEVVGREEISKVPTLI